MNRSINPRLLRVGGMMIDLSSARVVRFGERETADGPPVPTAMVQHNGPIEDLYLEGPDALALRAFVERVPQATH